MTNEELTEHIKNVLPEAECEVGNQFLTVSLDGSKLRRFMESLRNDEKTQFDYMFCLSGVDRPEHLEVVYHLRSTTLHHELEVIAKTADRETPELPTLCDIWRTAELHEREAYDFYGIKFTGHPDLRRIFLEDDWVGWPMRKDYEDPINMISY